MAGHLSHQLAIWAAIDALLLTKSEVQLDGSSLSMPELIAASRHGVRFRVSQSEDVARRMEDSADMLSAILETHTVVYGVNTAPGGNADLRTKNYSHLQHSFFQHHQSGILAESMLHWDKDVTDAQGLPLAVVRASAVVRCNSLARGHSAIRQEVVQCLADIVSRATGEMMSAAKALGGANISPISLAPKEGLAIVNGTSVSTAYAALVLQDCHDLAIICQLLTAMAAEALMGRLTNFHPFISEVRPHPGQSEVAQNIRDFLAESELCHTGDIGSQELAQGRYAIRTVPQWIGPQLEDLMAADAQISIELNATTDNPLVDAAEERFYHGGNFQASSVTSAMEKSRTAITMMGRLLLAQSGELVNPTTNKGLPPNLCADDPSLSFTCKGIDVNMTAYFSELAFLANSVASHVQTAELQNQSANSLALIAARMTGKATELLAMMCAAHLFLVCQAMDLRVRDREFLDETSEAARPSFLNIFRDMPGSFATVWQTIHMSWQRNSKLDARDRCDTVATDSAAFMLKESSFTSQITAEQIREWQSSLSSCFFSTFVCVRERFFSEQSTPQYLGEYTARMYRFVRLDLDIPFHRGLVDHSPLVSVGEQGHTKSTVGSSIAQIFLAIQNKAILRALM